MYKILVLFLSLSMVTAIHEPDTWHPFQHQDYFQNTKTSFHPASSPINGIFDHGYQNEGEIPGKDQCAVHKVAFTQDLYFQYIQYKTSLPDLKQFTLCFWSKFYNHSNDHPIFSYAVDGQPRAIYSWVSNTERSSYFSLAVDKHTFYRLNYPLRLNRWYHTCQSWNGKTGEWQIWVNAERVGRGFHNRLVGHTIPGGGIAITGQEQRQLGGGFEEGPNAPKGSGGMLGEITMLQFYKVALTAGKAHKDHKHHHAHQFDHNGMAITTPSPTTPSNLPTLPPHPLLIGGQINPDAKLMLAAAQLQRQPQVIQGQNYPVQYANGQIIGNVVAQQFQTQQLQQQQQQLQQQQQQQQLQQQQQQPQPLFAPGAQQQQQPALPFPGESGESYSSQYLSLGDTPVLNTGLNHLQYTDNSQSALDVHNIFQRNNDKDTALPRNIEKRQSDHTNPKKRQIYDLAGGSILEEPLRVGNSPSFEQSLLSGLAAIGQNDVITEKQKQADEREPAEAEVKAVLNVCNGCDEEPFDKALVFGWRTVPKKLYSGAYYAPAIPECKVF